MQSGDKASKTRTRGLGDTRRARRDDDALILNGAAAGRTLPCLIAAVPPPEMIRDSLEPVAISASPLSMGMAIALGIGLALGLALIFLWNRRRPKRAKFGSPRGRAKMRLSLLNPEAVSSRDLFRELSAILADYLTAQVGVAATRQTSPEIVAALRTAGFAPLPELQTFLNESDRARFAASESVITSGRSAIDQCGLIIERVDALLAKGKSDDAAV